MAGSDFFESWNSSKSAELYGINEWGAGYYSISKDGHLLLTPRVNGEKTSVSFSEIISGITDRGLDLPVLLRVENLLDSQLTRLNESFRKAIKAQNYKGQYRGVYPIKVNQQEHVVQEITRFGARYHHGLEAGSKAELIAALGVLEDNEACLICNGYKDEEFIDIGLNAAKMGCNIFFVIEMPGEMDLIIERSRKLGVVPQIGIRFKLSATAGGHWSESGGDRSIFGLTSTQIIEAVDKLRTVKMLDSLKLLHFHLGSQIPNIRDIRQAVLEGARLYGGLINEGAPMGYFDLGGGLAVDYDGTQTNYLHSKNYSLDEYTNDIIEVLISVFDEEGVPHPHLISESGRATVAYYSILIVNVLDVTRFDPTPLPESFPPETPEIIINLHDVLNDMNQKNLQECFNDAVYYRDQMRQQFQHGQTSLRERSLAENIFLTILNRIRELTRKMKRIPPGIEGIENALADIYYANFSVFQSLPDAWAIDQVFPVMPLTRLNEAPTRKGIIADITCDCDGRIDRFISVKDLSPVLPLHEVSDDEDYYLGFFLVGAYQETLGDLHNLLGDTNVVSIRVLEDGSFDIVRELEGDTIADVLSYVEYEPKQLLEKFRRKAEAAVKSGHITARERREMVSGYENSLRGYTYYEREN
ncbi:MAG: biosynthetic arginine decarboxylase [Spirochaetales bacterium]|nr:biosynthetic arginine decarboxylase [Spirochaetales bacterium]